MTMDEEIIETDEEDQNTYDEAETRAEVNAEVAEGYGAPQPEERINQYKITHDAIKAKDVLKTTYLTKAELGRPLFSTRFYLDCAAIARNYNAKLIEKYFLDKVKNITSSGMSNEGFIMKLNVTTRRDVTRKHERKVDNKDTQGEIQ